MVITSGKIAADLLVKVPYYYTLMQLLDLETFSLTATMKRLIDFVLISNDLEAEIV